MSNEAKGGFTLVELLVVIGIVLAIASIAYAAFASALESGRSTACLSNERQISAALLMYWDSYSAMPLMTEPENPWEKAIELPAKIANRLAKEELRCPDFNSPSGLVPPLGAITIDSGYALNDCTSNTSGVSDVANTVLLTEQTCVYSDRPDGTKNLFCRDIAEFPDFYYTMPGFDMQLGSTGNEPVGSWGSKRHRGLSHYALLDGHVATLDPMQIAVPKHDNVCFANAADWRGNPSGPKFAAMPR
jgi:prepilin-type N-terminal cleavage/methylation domain-containing protein/prepilin-type processing-associated H-X9-DG protein